MALPVVKVRWLDACLHTTAIPLSRAVAESKLTERTTVGFLVHSDKDKIVLAMTYDAPEGGDEATVDDRLVIPLGWVKKIQVLREPRR